MAARVLKPGRPLVVLIGKLRLPQVIAGLTAHLEYVWEGCIAFGGGHRRVRKLLIDDAWRPFLILSAGTFEPRTFMSDMIVCSEPIGPTKAIRSLGAAPRAVRQSGGGVL